MLLKTVIFYSIIFFYIKIFSKKKSLFNINQNILIESYSLLNFKNVENFNKNIFKFSNKNLLLVPNFLPEKKLHLIFNRINNIDDSKHIFRENYLSVNDFFYSLFHFFRKKKFIKKHKKFNQWDLTPLINGEIKSNKNFYSAILGISNFRFFANLKRKKIQLYKIISLFENQAVSRGWCCGSRTYFSKTENIGYQGYINFSQYLNSHPCNFEEKAKILPNKLAVISKYFKKNKREFFPKLKVTLAPALNLSTEYKKIKKRNKNLITLILTGIIEIDQKLINWSLNFVKKNKKTKLEIKFHPILAPDKFDLRIFNNNSNQIKIADKDISKLLDRSKIVISTGPTSAIYQAYLKECYLIIPVFDPWDKLNLENCKIPKSNYVLVNNFKEFRFNLKNMINNKDRNKLKFTKNNFIYNNCNSDNMKIFQ